METNFKIDDFITQNAIFYEYWDCSKFKRKITKIKDNLIFFEEPVKMIAKGAFNIPIETICFHQDYLQLNITEIRKEKLKKLNDRI